MMNTRTHRILTRTARIAASTLLALSALGTSATIMLAGEPGSIWTTGETCSAPAAQNANHYIAGDTVYVRGKNFDATADITWTITGLPGGASGDPGLPVSPLLNSGVGVTDALGSFCVDAYVVANDDWGVYRVDVQQGGTSKSDNYTVDGPAVGTGGGTTGGTTTDTTGTTTGGDTTGTTGGDTTGTTGGDTTGTTGGTTTGTTGGTTTGGDTTGTTTVLSQDVLGIMDTNSNATLPPTDTTIGTTGSVMASALIAGLATLAGAAVLFAPTRRREINQAA